MFSSESYSESRTDMSCGGHVRSTRLTSVFIDTVPRLQVGVTISTIVSFTRVGTLKNSFAWRVLCEADPSSPVLVKASS
jgi:hypothetical protein